MRSADSLWEDKFWRTTQIFLPIFHFQEIPSSSWWIWQCRHQEQPPIEQHCVLLSGSSKNLELIPEAFQSNCPWSQWSYQYLRNKRWLDLTSLQTAKFWSASHAVCTTFSYLVWFLTAAIMSGIAPTLEILIAFPTSPHEARFKKKLEPSFALKKVV